MAYQQPPPKSAADKLVEFAIWTAIGAVVVAVTAAAFYFFVRYILPFLFRLFIFILCLLELMVVFIGGFLGGVLSLLSGGKMPDHTAIPTHICSWIFCIGMAACLYWPMGFLGFIPLMMITFRLLSNRYPDIEISAQGDLNKSRSVHLKNSFHNLLKMPTEQEKIHQSFKDDAAAVGVDLDVKNAVIVHDHESNEESDDLEDDEPDDDDEEDGNMPIPSNPEFQEYVVPLTVGGHINWNNRTWPPLFTAGLSIGNPGLDDVIVVVSRFIGAPRFLVHGLLRKDDEVTDCMGVIILNVPSREDVGGALKSIFSSVIDSSELDILIDRSLSHMNKLGWSELNRSAV